MQINYLGIIAAATAFLCVWMGHVSVRKIEARTVKLWIPMVIFSVMGIFMEITALYLADRRLSMVVGIIGTTLLWDVLELRRQARRVQKGHAPANLNNPRHVYLVNASAHQSVGKPKA